MMSSVVDANGVPALTLWRPFALTMAGGKCRPQVLHVFSPGTRSVEPARLGSVEQIFSLGPPRFAIRAHDGVELYRVAGPLCTACNASMNIYDTEERLVGFIERRYNSAPRELLNNAENYLVTFPTRAGTVDRALCMAAVFLLDLMLFEDTALDFS